MAITELLAFASLLVFSERIEIGKQNRLHPSSAPRLVYGGSSAPRGWVAQKQSVISVCWDAPTPISKFSSDTNCWQAIRLEENLHRYDLATKETSHSPEQSEKNPRRIDLQDKVLRYESSNDEMFVAQASDRASDRATDRATAHTDISDIDLRFSFASPKELIIADTNEHYWRLRKGEQVAVATELNAAIQLEYPQRHTCSPTKWMPVLVGADWQWEYAPCDPKPSPLQCPQATIAYRFPRSIFRSAWNLHLGIESNHHQALLPRSNANPSVANRWSTSINVFASIRFRPRRSQRWYRRTQIPTTKKPFFHRPARWHDRLFVSEEQQELTRIHCELQIS